MAGDQRDASDLYAHSRPGFSLAEMLAAMTIGSMVLVAVLSIYDRTENAASAIRRRLDNSQVPSEVLQRIAEDLDRILAPDSDTKITVKNKIEDGYSTAQLRIVKTIYDKQDKPQTFEEIIWQAGYDFDSDANGLVLFRGHSGMAVEDKLLEEQREDWERNYPLVPICEGVTYFKIQVLRGENLVDVWAASTMPPAIVVTISFAEPFEGENGAWDVFEEEKITRTIATDRTRKIRLVIEKRPEEELAEGMEEMTEEGTEEPRAEGIEEAAEEATGTVREGTRPPASGPIEERKTETRNDNIRARIQPKDSGR